MDKKRKSKIFFDSSVLISASISSTGESRYLLILSKQDKIKALTSEYAISESKRTLLKKLPEVLPIFSRIIQEANLKILPLPKKDFVKKCEKIIKDKGDAPILASAIKAKVDFLATLNRKHFLDDQKLKNTVAFKIIKPKDFKEKNKL